MIHEGKAYCDFCGQPVNDSPQAFITVHGPDGLDCGESSVLFEWSPRGRYCEECLVNLMSGVVDGIGLPDRYDKGSETDELSKELSIIRKVVE